jgi:mannose-6-phosphate isomerase-like protein (cupin superfamily)
MASIAALLVSKEAVKRDPALQDNTCGARKLMVKNFREAKEYIADNIEWASPKSGEKCAVQVASDSEVAFFTQLASQDRHYHRSSTEIYIVLEGEMTIEVEGIHYVLSSGDMIVVNPSSIHEIKPCESEFLCTVVTLNCGGVPDKVALSKAT